MQFGEDVTAVPVTLASLFGIIGVTVNLLVLWGVRCNRRSLLLPWLVFQLIIIMGCFGAAIYIGLHFTILSSNTKDEDANQKAYAVLCLFPMVAGIFFIFLWIFVDQLFIQMGTMKQLGMKSVSSSNLSQLRANIVSTSYSSDTLRSNKSVYKNNSRDPKSRLDRSIIHSRHQVVRDHNVPKASLSKKHLAYHTQSLPRPKETRHKIREFSSKLDLEAIRPKRAKSLEKILDSGSSSTFSSSSIGPNVWVSSKPASAAQKSSSEGSSSSTASSSASPPPPLLMTQKVRHSKLPPKRAHTSMTNLASNNNGFCTIDRARLRHNNHRSTSHLILNPTANKTDASCQTLPNRGRLAREVEKNIAKPPRRSQSFDLLQDHKVSDDTDDLPPPPTPLEYIGDLTCDLDELRRASSEHVLDRSGMVATKTVKIHPRVTEFHYPGIDQDEDDEDRDETHIDEDLPSPPSSIEMASVPNPVFPSLDHLEHQGGAGSSSSWLSKLNPKAAKGSSLTKDQIIDLYCQVGDVQL